ncbi:hypothetical protein DFQ26_005643 [Actinomortierella ambigua]|nr:hypothetical protein DFQ26_005643 [Actinomortierella ambigua]
MPSSPKLRPMLPRYHTAPRSRASTQRQVIMLLVLILFVSSGSMLVFRMLTRPFSSSGKDCSTDADYAVIHFDSQKAPHYDTSNDGNGEGDIKYGSGMEDPFVNGGQGRHALPHQADIDYEEIERQRLQQENMFQEHKPQQQQQQQQEPSLDQPQTPQQPSQEQVPVVGSGATSDEDDGGESIDGSEESMEGAAAEPIVELFERTLPDTGEKYLTYLPYAGITNQFYGMLRAMYVARALERTLIIPPITASSHDKSKQNQPWSNFLDLQRFQKLTGTKVVEVHELRNVELAQMNEIKCGITCGFGSKRTIDFTAKGFLKQWKLRETLYPLRIDATKLETIVSNLQPYQNDKFVCISNTYKIAVKEKDEWEQLGKHLFFTEPLERFAQNYLLENLGSSALSAADNSAYGGAIDTDLLPKYIAIHIRRGDFAEYCNKAYPGDILIHCLPSTEQIAERVAVIQERYGRLNPGKVLPVLVATNERRPEELKKFADNGWKYLDHDEIGTAEKLGVFGPMMVDQVFMAHAHALIGIRQSTFSRVGALRQLDWHHRQMEYM